MPDFPQQKLTIKTFLKQCLPPILIRVFKLKNKYGWFGDYPSQQLFIRNNRQLILVGQKTLF